MVLPKLDVTEVSPHSARPRILFSNHSRWGFFNQFGEFSSLAKFVGGSQEDASPFGSAARYVGEGT